MTNVVRRIYTARDYDTLKERVLSYLRNNYPTVFADTYESHFAMMAVELACKIADDMFFYLEHQFNELFIDTCGERRNMSSLVKLIDYRMRNRTAAVVLLNCSCEDYSPSTLTIEEGTVVSTEVEGVSFYVVRDYSFTGDRVFTIEAREGALREDEFIATGKTS